MTSSDGDTSGRGDPRSGASADGGRRDTGPLPGPGPAGPDPAGPNPPGHDPAGHDPAGLPPPADPWLAEAHTSAFGDAQSLRDLGVAASVPPPADTVPYTGLSHGPGDGPPRRRARIWLVAVLTAGVLLVAAMLAVDRFGAGRDDVLGSNPPAETSATPARTGAAPQRTPTAKPSTSPAPDRSTGPAAAPGTSPSAATPKVVYEVTASGSRNTGSVTYTDQDGEFIRLHGIALPWRKTVPVGVQRKPLVLLAQRKGGGDAGPVTCTITVNGKLLSSTTAHGKYASAQCSASG